MKTEKLTLQDCFKYPNGKIKSNLKEYANVIHFINENFNTYISREQKGYSKDFISDCKLILRPLSSLTDEEKIEISDYIFDGWDEMPVTCFYMVEEFIESIYEVGDNDEFDHVWSAKDYIELINKLREWNIDIDGLQERGIAVYE